LLKAFPTMLIIPQRRYPNNTFPSIKRIPMPIIVPIWLKNESRKI
jgi:hypothetical protein